MMSHIRSHLVALTDFRGREPRGEFWPYVGLVLAAAAIIAMAAVSLTLVLGGDAPSPSQEIVGNGAIAIVVIALLAASVARRLHDRGLSGAWGLMPLPFLGIAFYTMYRRFNAVGSEAAFNDAFVATALYNISLIVLIVLLIGRSDENANRFGPASDDR
jgi:uncharacterized membrane protein YhaH (DUF805 family)